MSVKNLKIGIPIEYFNENLCSEVYQTWNEVANMLEKEGATVLPVSEFFDRFSPIYLNLVINFRYHYPTLNIV